MNNDFLSKYADALWRGDMVPQDCAALVLIKTLTSGLEGDTLTESCPGDS